MPLPHTLLSLAAAVGLWWAGHGITCTRPALQPQPVPPVFAVPGSAYGSLMARLIRDSLYSYWHGGESAAPAPETAVQKAAPPPPPPPGRFARKGAAPPPPPIAMAEPEDISWLDQRVDKLARLEKSRTKRNNPLPLSAAHRRYVNAAGDVRLRLAYHLDPGDAILYEILHFHLSSRTQRSEASLKALSHRAMAYGLRQGGSLSDALTGAGAAINLLNDELRPENTQRDFQAIQHQRDILERSLARYGEIRSTAQSEGWWDGIPSVRRDELEEHAKLLTRIRDNVRRTQVKAPSGP